jgi:subtilisin family serine protease
MKKMIGIILVILFLLTTPSIAEIINTTNMPNDPLFEQQWALHNTGQTGGLDDADIDIIEAWDIETGSSNVIIAIIDSGIDLTHPDLIDNIWMNVDEIPDNGVDDDNNGYIDDYYGYDYTLEDNDPDPLDHNGHGTVMAGVIIASTNNNIGISGISWNCKLMPVKVVDANWMSGGDSFFDGIRYAVDNGANIICMAFAFPGPVPKLKDAIDYAYNHGVLLICAAGNFDNDVKNYPAAFENVMAVAGTDHSDQRMEDLYEFSGEWVKSNYGDWIDLAAPGENIPTTSPTYHVTLCDTLGYDLNYDILSGTTLAAPVVAGVAGLILSRKPELTPDEVRSILMDTSDPYLSTFDLGEGRVNAYNALLSINSPPEIPEIDGPLDGKIGEEYTFYTVTTDPEGDMVSYLFDFGDGNTSFVMGPYDSGIECNVSHIWFEGGSYQVKVKAIDEYNLESYWSDPIIVTMPNCKTMFSSFYRLLDNYPILLQLLEKILGHQGRFF